MSTSTPPRPAGRPEPDFGPDPFEIVVTHPAVGSTIMKVVGALDIATCPELDVHLDHELRDPGSPRVRDIIVDLTALELLSAAGVRSLLRAEAIARDQHVRLQLVITHPCIARVLVLLDGDNRLCVQPDLAAARRATA